ncbi:MAG: DUF3467 domain-containing protein [Planctomycetaceae bacterium]|nr:MAG: DUF3467 domain-containing protein [Planctomycetaceae bacterium]
MSETGQPTGNPGDDPNRQSEQVRIQHLSARVPERISRGAFSTGAIVMTGGTEFIIDFVQNLGTPASIAARVIMPHACMPQFIEALRKNLDIYRQRFGEPPTVPGNPPQARQPSAQEIYDELKLPDDQLSGAYANGVMIGHTPSEFKFDFLTNLFPSSAVSARVFLSVPQVPRLLHSLQNTYNQFLQRVQQQRGQQPPPPSPPEGQ